MDRVDDEDGMLRRQGSGLDAVRVRC